MQNKVLVIALLVFTSVTLCCCHRKDSPTIAVIHLKTDQTIPWEGRCSCDVGYVTSNDSLNLSGKIKYRGGVSSKFNKHSYALKLMEPFPFGGLPANKSWVLNASYIDKTFMRHKICYDLFRMMGENDLSPQCFYALVRENGKEQGLYVVMQRLNKQTLQLNLLEDNALIFKEPKIFYPDSLLPSREPGATNYHEQTYPDFDKGEDCTAVMDSFQNFLLKASDQEFEVQIGQWVDLNNIIDWQLLIMFTNNGDGVFKNFYLYKKDNTTPFRIALWDCDHSLGRDGDNELNMLERPANYRKNIMLNRLMGMRTYREALAERYRQLRDNGIFSVQTFKHMVQENDPYIRLGLPENEKLWPCNSDNYYDDNNYEQEKALLLDFIPLSLQKWDKFFGYKQ